MRDVHQPPAPQTHFFVCGNRRENSPLGPGCGERGDAVYESLKEEVARRRLFTRVWVTRTHCLGICPAHGATVAIYPSQRIVTEVEEGDAVKLFDEAVKP
jgi:(2Fe-2S) ferredoxin